MLCEPQNQALEGCTDHGVEVLGVSWGWTTTLVHDELTDPVDRPFTHQDVWRGQLDLREAGEDLNGGQCDVHLDLPRCHQSVTHERRSATKHLIG